MQSFQIRDKKYHCLNMCATVHMLSVYFRRPTFYFPYSFLPRCMQCRRGLAIRICPSVCPSVKRVHCDKTEERSVQIFIPYERSFSLLFWEEKWLEVATGDPFYRKFGSTGPRWSESPIFNRYSLVAPQPWHLAKKVQFKLIRSPLRAFQWA